MTATMTAAFQTIAPTATSTATSTTISEWKQASSALLLALWIPLMVALFFVARALRLPQSDTLILVFHRGVARLFNLDITQTGTLRQDRPTLYVGKLACLQNTLFFERQTRRAGKQVEIMRNHLTRHSNLIFFPEGTSTPGTHVAAFRSSLFAAAADSDTYIQPITIAYSHDKN